MRHEPDAGPVDRARSNSLQESCSLKSSSQSPLPTPPGSCLHSWCHLVDLRPPRRLGAGGGLLEPLSGRGSRRCSGSRSGRVGPDASQLRFWPLRARLQALSPGAPRGWALLVLGVCVRATTWGTLSPFTPNPQADTRGRKHLGLF